MQCIKILNMIKLFGKPIRVNKSSQDKKSQDVGANLFIGHLDPDVDEKVTFDRLDTPEISLWDPCAASGIVKFCPTRCREPAHV